MNQSCELPPASRAPRQLVLWPRDSHLGGWASLVSPVGTGHLAPDRALSSSASGGGAPGVRGRPGRGTQKGDRVAENPHLRSHKRQHMPTAGREGGGPPLDPRLQHPLPLPQVAGLGFPNPSSKISATHSIERDHGSGLRHLDWPGEPDSLCC